MRKYLNIKLADRSHETTELHGEDIARAGRHLIAKTLLADDVATVDPLSADNPLMFSAGPFAGTNMSNGNRLSVGCKSPLTGGIKESNVGGTFAVALGHLELAGFTLHGVSEDWLVIHLAKDGSIRFDDASPYMGKGNFEAAALLHEKYSKKVSIGLCGPVGEYQGLIAGISFSDRENRPVRLAGRGGVGAVMGSKKVKAVIVDMDRMPPLHDKKKTIAVVRDYAAKLEAEPAVQNMKKLGTAMVADMTNYTGGLPTRNFSAGQFVDIDNDTLLLGGQHVYERNVERGGDPSHACMPGCVIMCSNVYVDKDGKEMVSPLEYETLGLMGSNCGVGDPDDIARVNNIANDLGIDTIETGATLGILMDGGKAEYGDVDFMVSSLEDIRLGNENGRLLAKGTARVGEHYGIKRVPVIKQQAISAYDPRVIEVTAISMMVTAQGADHTVGNLPAYECADKTVEELAEQSFEMQVHSAVADSFGLCIFGRSVTNTHHQLIANGVNNAHGTDLDPAFIWQIGVDTLRMENQFNEAAGFTEEDDELPDFFHQEALPPTDRKARLHAREVNQYINDLIG
ncbi:MAG: aldehyde ferredoxin oxidoreductase [Rhodospirillaceae bacterium]|jgi:aldehyde:ferredoxin oxidoreductase|nr:aldehyde ferredoxin oxidoreductase [Rhodospirillaceae bacterium]MBT5243591.1 aldehyde ferredoxin oxidoreductase [Rhodospirillaceae bacterium]MBT5562179.1 aldehyde ferredoxin oxidoreductase [Rhodospirillaceae bacterium]MBT6242352.1 aldehyde ferredoxin oxidoreductase [Rhodospirillaceae bacterium]